MLPPLTLPGILPLTAVAGGITPALLQTDAGPNNTDVPILGPQVTSVHYEVSLPAWLVASVSAHTTNGPIKIGGITSDKLDLLTTSGPVSVQAPVQDADVSTTNGGITLQGEPIASGKLDLRTTNGGVSVT